ncbi:MAG: tRNA (adenosine(37)-N6)-threonylcarbamoyltransferase complex dimerization subunit type 1 TsaB, partial [Proteobacteria bacterium]|nr:tRNA (adenosine(37)-N6)-threonylcarbamoyltransferase complex dimerization subunit type 1 TsaB [Pseudomonadota bacterium]
MNVLALDTATAACSVALWSDGTVLAQRFATMARGHAEALMPMVEAVMAEAGLAFADLDLVATTVGPGTFTGLRVGLAAARGLALAGGLPIVGVT